MPTSVIVETERLLLAEATKEDREFIYELLNTHGWLKHIGDRGINTLTDAESYITDSLIKSYRNNGFGLYKVLKKDNQSIGICGLLKREKLQHPDIGFATLPQFEGAGYTFEASQAIVADALSRLGYTNILGLTSEENLKSQKLLRKLGMQLLRKERLQGFIGESLIFSLEIA